MAGKVISELHRGFKETAPAFLYLHICKVYGESHGDICQVTQPVYTGTIDR